MLFVCLGSICRSPTAEGVLKHLLATVSPPLPIEVDSAGTESYHIGAPPDVRSQRAALRRGIRIADLRARRVELDDFAQFDLILATDRSNLRDLEALRPADSRAEVRLFLEYAGGNHDGGGRASLDVPDPYLGDESGFEHVLDLVTEASRKLLEKLQQRAQ